MLLLLLVLPHGGFALATTGSESEFTTDSADALVELTQANFNDYLRNNGCADWHGVCQQFEPTWRALAEELAGKLTVGRINFNEERELTERFGVTTLPTFKFIYGDGIAVDYKGELNATQIANYGLTLLRPQVLTLATPDDLSRFALPYSAFILFHQPHDSSALAAFVDGIRPFVEAEGVLFARSHSLEFARDLLRGDDDDDALPPPLPFAVVVKDWDRRPGVAARVRPVVAGDTKGLVAFFEEHWMPLLPRLEAASFRLQELQHQPGALGVVIAVGPGLQLRATRIPLIPFILFLDVVRQVAHEYGLAHSNGGTPPRLAFSWVEGPQYQQWLSDFGVGEHQFGSHVFVLDSLRKSYYPGVGVHSADDLRDYLQRIQSGYITKADPLAQAQKMAQHKPKKGLAHKELGVLAVVEDWVNRLELPEWWRPSRWTAVSEASPNAAMYLSLVAGLVFSLVLLCINRAINASPATITAATSHGTTATANAQPAPEASSGTDGLRRRKQAVAQ
ncbi:thioredoxin domain containing protein [Acanthamoeba castellanii str. Neff]|uniref:Thioredoxin domain containing protein n=1 Tax=Acanthamoeba castellanii (strain ATCC 30010 / Neff) TaxID=1257118 RepID=L8GYS8_ACACF|nr:thioredoxin domain containing protein [Acanthamoeba castellanii str. Neff]ELR17276.1 thioredoxin domain containing protein [Acanthamoeba castellanii str. Neff]